MRACIKESVGLLLMMVLILFIKGSVIDWYVVPSSSMEPALEPGDLIVVNKLAYGLRVPVTTSYIARWDSPVSGDVVVFKDPVRDFTFGGYIKRVLAEEGDHVQFSNKTIIKNGKPIECSDKQTIVRGNISEYSCTETEGESYTVKWYEKSSKGDDSKLIEIPSKHLLFIGDNRNNSVDSRYWGTRHIDNVYGKKLLTLKGMGSLPLYLCLAVLSFMLYNDLVRKPRKN